MAGFVYILASRRYGTLYTGVTNDLARRLIEHRDEIVRGFTKTNGVKRLVWFEEHDHIGTAIHREKLVKKWHRDWKIRLIEEGNPDWQDLARSTFGLEPMPSRPPRTPYPKRG